MREEFIEALSNHPALTEIDVASLVEEPRDASHGDYAFPCFSLASKLKKNPVGIASEIAGSLASEHMSFEAEGPYVNARLTDAAVAKIGIEASSTFETRAVRSGTVLIEYSQPNTNKPLHIGHMRNMLLGKALIETIERGGSIVVPVVLYNDRGIAICKSMLAYERFADGETPESTGEKGDHFVGRYYRMFTERAESDPTLEDDAREMLRRWEAGDEQVRALWKTMNAWAIEGFRETFRHFSLRYVQEDYESDVYEEGARIVREAVGDDRITTDDSGAVLYERKDEKQYTLLREDGTALYITQDIALLKRRVETHEPNECVYVVAKEQAHHFETLFELASELDITNDAKLTHYAYGLVTLPEGKMSSRAGRIVLADDLLEETIRLARAEVLERDATLDDREATRRAETIAFSALAFFMLKHNPMDDIIYNAQAAMRFEGETGPYVQYTYARIRSVLRKVEGTRDASWNDLEAEERSLLRELSRYPEVLDESALRSEPSRTAHYLLGLAQAYNSFYHACRVDGNEHESRRIALCERTAAVLEDGLGLLGIDVLEVM